MGGFAVVIPGTKWTARKARRALRKRRMWETLRALHGAKIKTEKEKRAH